MKTSDILRWILIAPLSAGAAALISLVGFTIISMVFQGVVEYFPARPDPTVSAISAIAYLVIAIATSVSAVCAWLYVSYETAPSHKSKVVCVSYVVGLMTMFWIFDYQILHASEGLNTAAFVVICSGVFAGLVYTIYLYRKSEV